METVKTWLYHPATRDGKPIAVRIVASVRFELRGSRPAEPSGWVPFPMRQADFPSGAWDRGKSGITALLVSLDERGRIANITTTKSSGHSDLDQAARQMVGRWHVEPARLDHISIKTLIAAAFIWPDHKSADKTNDPSGN